MLYHRDFEGAQTIMKCTFKVPDLTALMTSFSVGIISSMRMSGGKPRSSKAGSARAPESDKVKEDSDVRLCVREPQSVDMMVLAQ